MDIQALGILNNIAVKENVNLTKNIGDTLSFSQVFLEISGKGISVNDMFSDAFPVNAVDVKAGNCNVSSEMWERMDFPVWQYFHKNVNADRLNDWKPTGVEPTGAEPYIQQELNKIGFGEMVVLMPESLQKKMEADPAYAQEIMKKVQKWKTDYDRMDNAIAASYGDDPVLYQMTKSYCIQLDEDGNVGDYTVISGGMDTKRSDETNEMDEEIPKRIVSKTVKQSMVQRVTKDFITGVQEVDYTMVAPYLAAYYKNSR